MGFDQALIARAHGRKMFKDCLRPALVVARPVAHRPGLRGEQRQPAIQILVQRDFRVDRQALRQPQIAGVAPGYRQLFAGAGDLLQQVAPEQQIPCAGGFDADPAGAAHGTEQQRQWPLHAFQIDPRLREIRVGATGDEAVPDTTDPLFHFDGKGHGGYSVQALKKQNGPLLPAGPSILIATRLRPRRQRLLRPVPDRAGGSCTGSRPGRSGRTPRRPGAARRRWPAGQRYS